MVITLLIALIIVVVLLGLGSQLRLGHRSVLGLYTKRPSLFTQGEQAFLTVLEKAVGNNYRIFGQVRVADVVKHKHQAAFNRVQSKSFDFILCDPKTTEVVLVIELNDNSHNHPDRKDRDAFLEELCKAINLPLILYKAQASYDVYELQGRITKAIGIPTSKPIDGLVPWKSVVSNDLSSSSDLSTSSPFNNKRLLKMLLAIAPLIIIAVVIYTYTKTIPEDAIAGLQSAADAGRRQADKALAQAQTTRKEQPATQEREAQKSGVSQRQQSQRELSTQQIEQEKERAWLSYFHPNANCEHPTDWRVTVECGNDRIRAKREFDAKWQAEHGGNGK